MKKFLALVLTLAMVLTMFSFNFTASAENEMPAGAIAIDSVAGLKNMQAGKYYYLTKDLTLGSAGTVKADFKNSDAGPAASDYETAPVEEALITIPAGATLDGNGHTIYMGYILTNPGMYSDTEPYTSSLAWSHAMLAIADSNPDVANDNVTVKNLKFGSETNPIEYCETGTIYGIFADGTENTDVTFDNITIYAHRGNRGLSSAAMGLLMKSAAGYIQVKNSRVEGEWVSAGGDIGGFFCTTGNTCTLEMTDCVMNARLAGSTIGGFINMTNYCNESTERATISLIRCSNTYTKNPLTSTGGTCGILRRPGGAYCTVYMEDCVNYADISDGANLAAGMVSHVNTTLGELSLNGCVNYGDVTSTKDKATNSNLGFGGVLGHVNAQNFTITDCINYGNISGLCNLGGVIGRIDGAKNGAKIIGCKNYGTVKNIGTNTTGDAYIQTAGGIVGQVAGANTPSVLLQDCVNFGSVNPGTTYAAAAGIISAGHGASHTWTLKNCKNFGYIGGTSGIRRAGGLIGYTIYVNKMSVTNCENYGTVSSTEYSGGIACNLYQGSGYEYTFTGCQNYGLVQGHHIVGGIVGRVGHVITKLEFNKCLNAGTVKPTNLASGESLGGIVGWVSNTSTKLSLTDCINTGTIYGSTKNTQAYGAFGDSFGQLIGAYNRTGSLNYAANPYVGGFTDWSNATYKPVVNNCYVYGTSVLGSGAKSMTGWIIGYDNAGVPTVYDSTTKYTASTVAATVPNGGAYGILVEVAEGSTIHYLKDTNAADAAEIVSELLGTEMIAGAADENPIVVATPEIRGVQMSKDKTSIRFVAAISSSNYANIGYTYSLTYNGATIATDVKATSPYVLKSVNATGDDGSLTSMSAESLCGKYLTAITFNGVPAKGTLVLTATPTATTANGTTYAGAAYSATIVDGALVSVVEVAPATATPAATDSVTVSDTDAGIVIDYAG